ncbi:hypothetical protein FC07_GL001352 [Loigolactobacillus bifermentans DSM 20003]|jgi:hypothetical protein|uniref:Uncharacterized protein n=2 Tax=Loigolactobacillus bifermentans TaxID=1607 RepID=A0A0R1HAR9_9LACO|nr:hypothetical protein FC07_GL001352 [Loigolactobacillus bifermentans DSM 20003]
MGKRMLTVFDALKMIQVNHQPLDTHQVVMTDPEGKPNSILTDLLTDVVTKTRMFVEMDLIYTSDELIENLQAVTPLPVDVLSEYTKILDQPIVTINVAPQKQLVELVYDEYSH